MTKFLPLIFTTLGRKPLRTVLTILSIGVAFLLFGVLESFRYGLTTVIGSLNDDRLITTPAGNQLIPLSHLREVQQIHGIAAASGFAYIPVLMGAGQAPFGALAVDPGGVLEVYPDLQLSASERQQWLTLRAAAVVGRALANRHAWKVGDTVALPSTVYINKDGTRNWQVTIVAIIAPTRSGFGNDLYLHYDYFNESAATGANTLTYIMSRVSDARAADAIRTQIDEHFANSAGRTKTTQLSVYTRRAVSQLGNIGAVIIVVIVIAFFTMILITASTMGQSVRERASEFAVMKTVGYTDRTIAGLVLSEALLMSTIGAVIALVILLQMASTSSQGGQNSLLLAPWHVVGLTGLLVVACSIAACLLPILQVRGESVVEGLRHE